MEYVRKGEMMDRETQEYIDKAIQQAIGKVEKPTPRLLGQTLHEWFVGDGGSYSDGKMGLAFKKDGYRMSRLWDYIRPMTMIVCDKKYVRDANPQDAEKINEIADRICRCVYDCREEWIKYKEKDK